MMRRAESPSPATDDRSDGRAKGTRHQEYRNAARDEVSQNLRLWRKSLIRQFQYNLLIHLLEHRAVFAPDDSDAFDVIPEGVLATQRCGLDRHSSNTAKPAGHNPAGNGIFSQGLTHESTQATVKHLTQSRQGGHRQTVGREQTR
jgi:hypothetical protein